MTLDFRESIRVQPFGAHRSSGCNPLVRIPEVRDGGGKGGAGLEFCAGKGQPRQFEGYLEATDKFQTSGSYSLINQQ